MLRALLRGVGDPCETWLSFGGDSVNPMLQLYKCLTVPALGHRYVSLKMVSGSVAWLHVLPEYRCFLLGFGVSAHMKMD